MVTMKMKQTTDAQLLNAHCMSTVFPLWPELSVAIALNCEFLYQQKSFIELAMRPSEINRIVWFVNVGSKEKSVK